MKRGLIQRVNERRKEEAQSIQDKKLGQLSNNKKDKENNR